MYYHKGNAKLTQMRSANFLLKLGDCACTTTRCQKCRNTNNFSDTEHVGKYSRGVINL